MYILSIKVHANRDYSKRAELVTVIFRALLTLLFGIKLFYTLHVQHIELYNKV